MKTKTMKTMKTMKTTIKTFALLGLTMLLLNSCSKKEDEIQKYKVEFSPVKNSGGGIIQPAPAHAYYVTAQIDGNEIQSGDEVEEGKEIVFTAYAGVLSRKRLQKWEVTGADSPSGTPETFSIKVKGPLKVEAVFITM